MLIEVIVVALLFSAALHGIICQQVSSQPAVKDFSSLRAALNRPQAQVIVSRDIVLQQPLLIEHSVVITGTQQPDGRVPYLSCNKRLPSAFQISGNGALVSLVGLQIRHCTSSAIMVRNQSSLALQSVELTANTGRASGVALHVHKGAKLTLQDCKVDGNVATNQPGVNASVVHVEDVLASNFTQTVFTTNTAPVVLNIFLNNPPHLKNASLFGAPKVAVSYGRNFVPSDPFSGKLLQVDMKNASFTENTVTDSVVAASHVHMDASWLHVHHNLNTNITNSSHPSAAGGAVLMRHSTVNLHSTSFLNNTNFGSTLGLFKMYGAARIFGGEIRNNVAQDIVRVDGCHLVQSVEDAEKLLLLHNELNKNESGGFRSRDAYLQFRADKTKALMERRANSYFSPLHLEQVRIANNTASSSILRLGSGIYVWEHANLLRIQDVQVTANIIQPSATTALADFLKPPSGKVDCTPWPDSNAHNNSAVVVLGHGFGTVDGLTLDGNYGPSIVHWKDTNVTFTNITITNNVANPGPAMLVLSSRSDNMSPVRMENNRAYCSLMFIRMSKFNMIDVGLFHNQRIGDEADEQKEHAPMVISALKSQLQIGGASVFRGNVFRYVVGANLTVVELRDIVMDGNMGGGLFAYTPYPLYDDQSMDATNLTFSNNKLTRGVLGAMVVVAPYWRVLNVTDSRFIGNQVVANGTAAGGLFVAPSINHRSDELTACCQHEQKKVVMTGVTFKNNIGLQGGALWIGRPADITNNIFEGNVAAAKHLVPQGKHAHFSHSTVYNLYANDTSNIIQMVDAESSRVAYGFGPGLGGAIYILSQVDTVGVTVTNNTIHGNTANYGGAVFVDNTCALIRFQDSDTPRCSVELGNNTMTDNRVVLLNGQAGNAPTVFFVTSKGLKFTCKQGNQTCDRGCARRTPPTCLSGCIEWAGNRGEGDKGNGQCGGLGTRISQIHKISDASITDDIKGRTLMPGFNAFVSFNMSDEYDQAVEGDLLHTDMVAHPSSDLVILRTTQDKKDNATYTFAGLQLMPMGIPVKMEHYITFLARNGQGPLYGVDYKNGNNLSFTIRPCGLGEHLNLRICIPCNKDNNKLFSNYFDATCQDCPSHGDGSFCRKRGVLIPADGYWQPHMQSPQIHRCPLNSACRYRSRQQKLADLVEWATGNITNTTVWTNESGIVSKALNQEYVQAQCGPGYMGNLCGVCREGFGRLSTTCYKCHEGPGGQVLNAVVFLGALASICAVLAVTVCCQLSNSHVRLAALPHQQRLRVARALSMPWWDESKSPSYASIQSDAEGFVEDQPVGGGEDYAVAQPGGKENGTVGVHDSVSVRDRGVNSMEEARMWGEVAGLFKLLVTYIQGLGCLRFLDVQFPWSKSYVYQLDWSEFVSLDCSFPGRSPEVKAIIRTCILVFIPVLVLMLATAFWLLHWAFRGRKHGGWRNFLYPRVILTAVQIGYYLHVLSTAAVLNMFTCYRHQNARDIVSDYKAYEPLDREVGIYVNKLLWVLNYDTQCFKGRHRVLVLAIGVPWAIIFSIGTPLAFAWRTHKHRHELTRPEVFIKYGFLYEEYKMKYHWWESMIMARKILLLAFCTFWGMFGTGMQILTLLWVVLTAALLQEFCQPFHSHMLNILERWALFLLAINVLAFGFFALPSSEFGDNSRRAIVALLVIMNCAYALFILYKIYKYIYAALVERFDYDGDGKFGWSDMIGALHGLHGMLHVMSNKIKYGAWETLSGSLLPSHQRFPPYIHHGTKRVIYYVPDPPGQQSSSHGAQCIGSSGNGGSGSNGSGRTSGGGGQHSDMVRGRVVRGKGNVLGDDLMLSMVMSGHPLLPTPVGTQVRQMKQQGLLSPQRQQGQHGHHKQHWQKEKHGKDGQQAPGWSSVGAGSSSNPSLGDAAWRRACQQEGTPAHRRMLKHGSRDGDRITSMKVHSVTNTSNVSPGQAIGWEGEEQTPSAQTVSQVDVMPERAGSQDVGNWMHHL